MNQLELSFNDNSENKTLCKECLYDNECTESDRIELNKSNIGCKKFKLNDLPF